MRAEPDEQAADDDTLQRRADRVLAAALELAGDERQAYLDRACGGDGALRDLVLELLALCEEPDDLEQRAAASLASVHADLEREALGTDRIGPYRLVRELGRGGMGVVYLARREDGLYEHDVAVKVLHLGRVEQLGSRFARERQILAALDHPGIARLLDAGSTPAGQPYLVMERVEGIPIDRFCAERRLALGERLELFGQVCEAVEAAHRSLVIHRDIKPSNILVATDGRPKLLDFGIAKLLEDDPAAVRHTTVHMLTLEWASPEQLRGGLTTVQSDVYQLGLLLHLLLTGRLPYSLAGLSPAEQEALICDREAQAPSATVRMLPAADRSALAAQVGVSSGRVEAALAGDLDAIVLEALRKDPRHRYDFVAQLRLDVGRHLQRLPVSARPPTLRYRVQRYLGRHRLAALALAAFLALGSFSVLRITEERDHARREALRAEEREQEARAATDFLAGILRKASPRHRTQKEELTVRQALELGLEQLATELRDTPTVRARVLHELAEILITLGDDARGIELGNEAIGLWEAAGAGYRSELAKTLQAVGIAHQDKDDQELARRYFERSLAIQRQVVGDRHPAIASLLSDLAILADSRGETDETGRLFEEAVAILEATDEEAYPGQRAAMLANLGIFYKNLGRDQGVPGAFEKAEAAFRRCREELASRPELASRIPRTQVNLGNLYHEMGRLEESETSLRAAVEGLVAWYGADHPNIALGLSNLGRTLTALERFDDAEEALQRALTIREAAYGPDHPRVAVVVHRLGLLRAARQRPAEALPLLERALDVRRKVRGSGHPDVGDSLHALAGCHLELGENERAAELLREAAEIYDGAGHEERAAEIRRELMVLGSREP